MMRSIKRTVCIGLLLGMAAGADGFALLGPFKDSENDFPDPWQGPGYGGRPSGLGYQLRGDIGGPMFPLEFYRWNVPVLTYAFDSTFLRYFGIEGIAAVEEAVAILNALPAASAMTPSLGEFPLDSRGVNHTAATLDLFDVKSTVLHFLLEQMGLAFAERFVWGLRDRFVLPGPVIQYSTVQMNYDPITIRPSRYVNGVLYNFRIFDELGPTGEEWASAVEWYQLDPLFVPYSSVSGGFGTADDQLGSSPADAALAFVGLGRGEFYRGLTRDDAGGLRFLLSPNNYVIETLLPNVTGSGGSVQTSVTPQGGSRGWTPVLFATNITGDPNVPPGTTNVVGGAGTTNRFQVAIRPGVDKITFQRVNFDALIGTTFTPIVLSYTDTFIDPSNGRLTSQNLRRVVTQPDIVFAVGDLGTVFGLPIRTRRTTTRGWINNADLNTAVGAANMGGPGIITPSIVISLTDLVPYYDNLDSGPLDSDAFKGALWGSFDETDTPPVVFPVFTHPLFPDLSLEFLQSFATGGN